MTTPYVQRISLFAALALALAACQDSAATTTEQGGGSTAKKTDTAAAATGAAGTSDEQTTFAFKDTDFVESDQNRDPFRSFENDAKNKAPVVAQRMVLMPNTPINNMKLIAIVTGIDQPRAMIVDEKGVGYVTTRGDFVGQAEVVQSGGAENLPVTLNWRVDRIRENEVVLAREDPTGPNRPPLTKVIPLHDKEEEGQTIGTARRDDSG